MQAGSLCTEWETLAGTVHDVFLTNKIEYFYAHCALAENKVASDPLIRRHTMHWSSVGRTKKHSVTIKSDNSHIQ